MTTTAIGVHELHVSDALPLEPSPLRCIVVPLDGSPIAEDALSVAVALAKATGATVRGVHVFVPLARGTVVAGSFDYAANIESQLENDARAYVNDVGGRLQTAEGERGIVRVDLSKAVSTSRPFGETVRIVAALGRYARMQTADLIVMTSHGRGGFSRAWMGNVADAVMRGSGIPVLIVRPDGTLTVPIDFRHIVIALDGSPLAERVIPMALAIASATRARITLVRAVVVRWVVPRASPVAHVDTGSLADQHREADEYFARLLPRLRAPGLTIEARVVEEPVTMLPDVGPVRALLSTIETIGADMIAIATHGHGGVKRWWLGSVADKIVRGAPVATLVMRGLPRRQPGRRRSTG
jgi:nucleotide-binding universal stress UspA family protein